MAEQPEAQAVRDNNARNNQYRFINLAKEMIYTFTCCKIVSIVMLIVTILLLWDYYFFQTKFMFCESKPDFDACESLDIELLPKCPNKTIYIDIQENYFIVDTLFGQYDYDYSNYPLEYNWTIITNDANCDVIIEDTQQQQLEIHYFKDCDPFTINTTLNISVREFEIIYSKECNISLFFFESPIFGIDFGTTYSSISFQRKQKNDNNQRDTVIVNINGSKLIHSAVYFHPDKQTTIIGQNAMDFLETDAENVIYDIKRIIGRNTSQDYKEFEEFNNTHFFHITPNDNNSIYIPNWERSVSFEQIVAIIFGYLVESASNEWLKQKAYFDDKFNDFSKVVVSIPASFHTGQRNAIRNACILAGLNPIRLQSEPSLAALAFTNNVSHSEAIENDLKSFLAFDFGGGTLDCAIIRCDRKVQCTVVSVHGDNHLGGIDFDEVIQLIIKEKLREKNIDKYSINKLKFTIESMAEQIKIDLSSQVEVSREINGTKIVITRDKFENHIETEILKNQMVNVVKEVIARSLKLGKKYSVSKIRAVLLVGGTSKLPLVKNRLESYFRAEPAFQKYEIPKFFSSDIDEQLMIIYGAAIVSGALNFNDESSSGILATSITDVAPLPYGFARCESTATGLYPVNVNQCHIMHKISKTGQYFGTKLRVAEICQIKPKSTSMTLDLFEGFNKSVKFNYYLGQIIIHNIEARDPDKPCGNILLFGEIAENGSLTFDIFKNTIWEIIIHKFENKHDYHTEEIEKSNLYSIPQLYTNINKYLRMQRKKKRVFGDTFISTPYILTLTFDEGIDKINKSINITEEDFSEDFDVMHTDNKYEYTMRSEESLIETTSLYINNLSDTKSLFNENIFISVRYGIERAIRKEIKRRSEINITEKSDTELHMEELERMTFELKRYNEISAEIMTAAILSNLSYLAPYDKSRIISDIIINNTLYTILTGTQPNLHDMSFNVDIWKESKFGGRVHRGFHKRAVDYFGNTSFEIWFNTIFKNAQFSGGKKQQIKQIVFAGHSLGGAASEIIGSYFWKYCNQKVNEKTESFCRIPSQVITFGAPLTFQRGCNVHPNITHIVNDNDMIPRILRDFEFLYSGWFTIQMLWPHVPHVFAITVFLSMLSVKYTRYHTVQTIFVCGIWILMIYHGFSTETIRIDFVQYISPIFKWCGLKKVFCDKFHETATCEITYMWCIHLIMVTLLAFKRWIVKSVEITDDDDESKLKKVWSCVKFLFQPILDFFPVLLRLAAIFVPVFVGICFIAPHYYATGNVIHIQSHHRHGICNRLNAVEFYENMRTGYQESFFFHDHSIVYYTEVLKSLIEGKIQCGYALPESSMGQEIEEVLALLMVIICVLFFWMYFLRVVTKSAEKTDNPENNEPPFQPKWGYIFLIILSILSYFLGPMREYMNL